MSAVVEKVVGTTDLPDGWERRPLSALGEWRGGGTPSKQRSDFWEGGSIPWVSPKDMKALRLSGTQDRITPAAVDGSSAKLFPANSVAVVVRSGILEHTLPIALVPFEATANQDMRVLTPEPGLDPEWVLWALRASGEAIRRSCRKDGTTVASIDVGRMQAYEIPVPALEDQRRIVALTESLMAEVNQGQRLMREALDGLERYRASVLATGFGSPSAVLSEVAEIQSGIAKGRSEDGELIDMPYIRTANVQAMRLDLDEIKTLPVTNRQIDRYLLRTDDVLVLEGGDADKVGRGWIWSGEIDGCLHQNHVFAVRPDPNLLVPRYLAYYINAPQARAYFLSVAKQTTNLASINKTNLNALPLPLPSLEIQRETVSMLDRQLTATAHTEAELRVRLADSEQLRNAVLYEAFSGVIAR